MEKATHKTILDRDLVKVGGRDRNVEFLLDDEVEFLQLEEELRRYLDGSRGWFSGGVVKVNIGRRALNTQELARLKEIFQDEFQLHVDTFSCMAETLEQAISEAAGVNLALLPSQRFPLWAGAAPHRKDKVVFVKSTCRSGTTIHHDGDVVVLGDVNPGAQIIASGDIVVLGALRGVAHAASDYRDPQAAVIIALSLQPMQLRIGRHVSVAPAEQAKGNLSTYPEVAYLSKGSIVVAPFTGRFHSKEEEEL